jgi:anaerobic ribonucleoside-triphosphate reductase activating protein
MRVGRIYYPVKVLGYGKRLGIWFSGCNFRCSNCISQELRNSEAGVDVSINEIIQIIKKCDDIDGITISGGEPFLQYKDLARLIEEFIQADIDDIIIYSGYTFLELKEKNILEIDYILKNVACLVLGRYQYEFNDGNGIVGSTNQQVIVNKYIDRHSNIRSCKREQQMIFIDDRIVLLGVAPKESE